jgi:hypothetical protein
MSNLILKSADRREAYAIPHWYKPLLLREEWMRFCRGSLTRGGFRLGIRVGEQPEAQRLLLIGSPPVKVLLEHCGYCTYREWIQEAGVRDADPDFTELESVLVDAQVENWDGEGAVPVTPEAYHHAREFLRKLPPDIPAPEVAADPDGEIALEWYRDPGFSFSISIGPTGRLAYAGLFGPENEYGNAHFTGVIPRAILEHIRGLFREEW